MKIYDCGDCYITTRLADWEVLAMLQGEGWDIQEVKEVTEEEYQHEEEREICPYCNGTDISPYERDGGSCPHCFGGYAK